MADYAETSGKHASFPNAYLMAAGGKSRGNLKPLCGVGVGSWRSVQTASFWGEDQECLSDARESARQYKKLLDETRYARR